MQRDRPDRLTAGLLRFRQVYSVKASRPSYRADGVCAGYANRPDCIRTAIINYKEYEYKYTGHTVEESGAKLIKVLGVECLILKTPKDTYTHYSLVIKAGGYT